MPDWQRNLVTVLVSVAAIFVSIASVVVIVDRFGQPDRPPLPQGRFGQPDRPLLPQGRFDDAALERLLDQLRQELERRRAVPRAPASPMPPAPSRGGT